MGYFVHLYRPSPSTSLSSFQKYHIFSVQKPNEHYKLTGHFLSGFFVSNIMGRTEELLEELINVEVELLDVQG